MCVVVLQCIIYCSVWKEERDRIVLYIAVYGERREIELWGFLAGTMPGTPRIRCGTTMLIIPVSCPWS